MSLRSKLIRLAADNPNLRPQLLQILGSRMPGKGDMVRVRSLLPGSWKRDQVLKVLDTREVFTRWGPRPLATQLLVTDPTDPGSPQTWVFAWEFWEGPPKPKSMREPVDEALSLVLTALRPFKNDLKRTNSLRRGGRRLEPKSLSTNISYAEVVRLMDVSFAVSGKGGNVTKFVIQIQVGENQYEKFEAAVRLQGLDPNGFLDSVEINSSL